MKREIMFLLAFLALSFVAFGQGLQPTLDLFLDNVVAKSNIIYPVLFYFVTSIWKKADDNERVENVIKVLTVGAALGLGFIQMGVPKVNIFALFGLVTFAVKFWKDLSKRNPVPLPTPAPISEWTRKSENADLYQPIPNPIAPTIVSEEGQNREPDAMDAAMPPVKKPPRQKKEAKS